MANYIAQCVTPRLSSEHIAKITVPAGGLHAGQVVVADTLDNAITGNIEVFSATQPAAGNLKSKFVGIVINDGFETLSDGRRPDGQPNYYGYEYNAGDTAPVVYLDSHLVFVVGKDSLDSATASNAAVGKYLYAVAGSNNLTVGDEIPDGTTTGLKVVALYNTPIGGQFGGGFASSFVCIAQ
jgi:hypothetical protein